MPSTAGPLRVCVEDKPVESTLARLTPSGARGGMCLMEPTLMSPHRVAGATAERTV
jgi:hypothetical protein